MIHKVRPVFRHIERRNYVYGILHGVFVQTAMNLTNPEMVLTVFIRALGGSNALVGLLPAIRFSGWFLPQFLVSSWVQSRPRKLSLVLVMEGFRVTIYGLLAGLTLALGRSYPALMLPLFFLLFTPTRFTAGVGALARLELIGQDIGADRRASFFAFRNFFGGACVFAVGFLVRYLLDSARGPGFPANFALLFGLSSTFFLLSGMAFSRFEASSRDVSHSMRSLWEQVARAPILIKRDVMFRRYLLARILLHMMLVVNPFYTVFALDVLGAPESMVGFYISMMTLSNVGSNLLWQAVERRRGTYFVIKAAGLLTALAPILAMTMPWVMDRTGFTVARYGLLPAYLFTVVFVLVGVAISGRGIGLIAVLLDIAPEEERSSYIGLVNTTLGVISLLSILSGAVIDWVGFGPVFFTATVLLLLGFVFTLRLRPKIPSCPTATED